MALGGTATELRTVVRRLEVLPDGVLALLHLSGINRHGARFGYPLAMVLTIKAGRISRSEEYFDS